MPILVIYDVTEVAAPLIPGRSGPDLHQVIPGWKEVQRDPQRKNICNPDSEKSSCVTFWV